MPYPHTPEPKAQPVPVKAFDLKFFLLMLKAILDQLLASQQVMRATGHSEQECCCAQVAAMNVQGAIMLLECCCCEPAPAPVETKK